MPIRDEDKLMSFKKAEMAYENDEMKTAINIFEALAASGDPEACEYLGLIFRTGDGVEKNELISRKWYRRQREILIHDSEQGNLDAALKLGKIYQYGNHVKIDNQKAFQYVSVAAEKGLPAAMLHLAHLYKYGWCSLGVDNVKYDYWLDQAIKSEDSEAMFEKGINLLGFHDMDGISLIKKSSERKFQPAIDYMNDNLKQS